MRRALLVVLAIASARAFAQPAPPEPVPPPVPDQPVPGDTGSGSGADVSPVTTPEPPKPAEPPAPVPPSNLSAVEQRQAASKLCEAHDPQCDWLAMFSTLEKQSVARALLARGLVIDPQPWGKPVAHVLVYNENVFAEKNWLQFFNFIHFTTREKAIRDELPIGAGDVWDDDKVAEAGRILRDPLFSSVVVLLPVKASEPGKVDLLVVTRDVWSLRFNTQYTYQQGSLTNLSISISENNFLGHRNVLAATALMDQGSLRVGPLFIDKNFLGKHLYFSANVREIMTRQSLDMVTPDGTHVPTGDPKGWEDGGGYRHEGRDGSLTLTRPLWSLATEWGGGGAFTFSNAIARSYYGTGLRSYDNKATPEIEAVPREFRNKSWSLGLNATRQWGSWLKQQFNFGYNLSSVHPQVLPNFMLDPMLQAAFIHDVFPHDEVISEPFVEYSFFTPKYKTIRNVGTYELAEDFRIGPTFDVSLAQALTPLGSTHTFTQPAISGSWTFPVGADGYITPSAGTSLRIQPMGNHDTIDNTAQVSASAVTPTLGILRIVAFSQLLTRWHDTQNAYYTIGSDSNLRGYPINAFYGQRRFSTIIEARTQPLPWWVLRLGMVAFYEAGGAANSLDEITLYQDVGMGVRMLIPQTSRELFRFDVALPLRASPGNPISPHFLAGFASYF